MCVSKCALILFVHMQFRQNEEIFLSEVAHLFSWAQYIHEKFITKFENKFEIMKIQEVSHENQ